MRERLPLPGLSFLCACAKFSCVVQSAEPYERGVRQRGGAGGTADRRWKKEYTLEQGHYVADSVAGQISWTTFITSRNKEWLEYHDR